MASSLASVVRGGSLLLTASSSSSGQSPCSLPSRVGLLVSRAPRRVGCSEFGIAALYKINSRSAFLNDQWGHRSQKGTPSHNASRNDSRRTIRLINSLIQNRIIFIGQPINSQVAQRVISQLVTLATIDEDADILIYINYPGGSTYSVLAIYDCMSWIKPKVGTVCFGVAASQGALLLAGGEKGMRYAMPNARIMIHQPQSGCGGHVEDVRRQVNEAVQSRHVGPSPFI
ncbi:hypothetical protein MLD38_036145 [Melastoma candidum]|uniref:Uncharacterized protein n=1 Tax=Melastoma candidum TaxID=119954 RepID=A0ACB9LIR7_9MYRT|nr:hypothetical protein MLD38_036145 [Melastoma candidum]